MPIHESIAQAFRVPNPVSRLPVHDNSVVIDVLAARHGETELKGTLTFGVDTAANNQLGDAPSYACIDAATSRPFIAICRLQIAISPAAP